MNFQWKIQQNNKPSRRCFFGLRGGESIDHVILKLVGFILFFDFDPEVEKDMGWKYKPDLIAFDKKRKVILWVECADVTVKKIYRVLSKYKDAHVVVLKLTKREAEQFFDFFREEGKSSPNGEEEVKYPENLTVIGFDEGFTDSLCENIRDRIEINAQWQENNLSIEWENFSAQTCVSLFGAESWEMRNEI